MTTRYEIDWRYSSIQRIFESLSQGLKSVEYDLDEAEQSSELYFDADMALEHADGLFGIAFVAAQTYITGVVSDANKVAKLGIQLKKNQLLKDYSDFLGGLTITKLEFCDAMANYFKHHDEWAHWSSGTGQNQKTIAILRTAGIREDDSYPCVSAANILLSEDNWDLAPLLLMLSSWREVVIEACKPK
jgi:hypothetical protein